MGSVLQARPDLGALALHARKGYRIKIACLSFGERGESQFAWKEAGATMEKVKAGRRDEAQRAAEMLGAEIEFFDGGHEIRGRGTFAFLDKHLKWPK